MANLKHARKEATVAFANGIIFYWYRRCSVKTMSFK